MEQINECTSFYRSSSYSSPRNRESRRPLSPTCRPPPAFVLLFGRPGISLLPLHGTPLSPAIHAYKHRGFIWAFYSGGGPTNRGPSLPTLLFPLSSALLPFLPLVYPLLFLPLVSLPLSLVHRKRVFPGSCFPILARVSFIFSLFASARGRVFFEISGAHFSAIVRIIDRIYNVYG